MSRFQIGYQWAMDSLIQGEINTDYLEVCIDANGIDANEFDEGARAALRDWNEREGRTDETSL